MRTFHIYTDASSKDTTSKGGVKRTTKAGVVVVDFHILDIYYNRKEIYIPNNIAEVQAICESIDYVKNKYNAIDIIVHTDFLSIITQKKKLNRKLKKKLKNIDIRYVRGHCAHKRRGSKYKFNALADWICANGLNWKDYYYRHLL